MAARETLDVPYRIAAPAFPLPAGTDVAIADRGYAPEIAGNTLLTSDAWRTELRVHSRITTRSTLVRDPH